MEIARLLQEMPEYARTKDGSRWKDSPLVQDEIFLRHPSVLMPVFPAEEVHMESPRQEREAAENSACRSRELEAGRGRKDGIIPRRRTVQNRRKNL